MLTLRTITRTHFPSLSHHHHHPFASLRRNNPSLSSSITMSSSSASTQIIEHIVLFKAKPSAPPSAIDAMLSNLNSLSSLDPVLHLSASPLHRCRSSSTLSFTHALHSRYRSRSDLDAYSDHPIHVAVVAAHVRPAVDDVMAVDWIADGVSASTAVIPPGSAVRLTVAKVKDGRGEAVVEAVRGSKGTASVGENFSPGRAKGYSICSIAVFKGMKEMEEAEAEAADVEKEFVDDVLVVEFGVGAAVQTAAASL